MLTRAGTLSVLFCLPLAADFSYEQTSKMTGGMLAGAMKVVGVFSKQAREPIKSFSAVKGNRMVHSSASQAQVIDLDAETITEIHYDKKTYSVITFAEMTQALEQAVQQVKTSDVKADFKVAVKETGQTREISGLHTKEVILSLEMEGTDPKTGQKGTMQFTSDMWLAKDVPGSREMHDFSMRMARKLNWTPGSNPMVSSDMARGMAGIYREASKLEGLPVLQIVKMGPKLTPEQEAQLREAQAKQRESESRQAKEQQQEKPSVGGALGGALGGRLGRLGGFGRKKKQEEPKEEPKEEAKPAQAASSEPPPDLSGALMEMTMETANFSSAPVDAGKFAVPAGFKKVDSELLKMRRR